VLVPPRLEAPRELLAPPHLAPGIGHLRRLRIDQR
jgi:hypothetical protein